MDGQGQNFDVPALYHALDAERDKRGISWAQLTRELNSLFKNVTAARPIAASTVRGMREKGGLNGNGVIQMLIWLKRSPESFCSNWPVKGKLIPTTTPDRIVRWNGPKIYAAIDTERAARGLTWKALAAEIGGTTPSALKGLARTPSLGFPQGMRIFRWLAKPAADYTMAVPW